MQTYRSYRIGMRNIKTAIAVLVSILLSYLLQRDYPFYIIIAAVISMESSVINSWHVGKNRVMGTVLGAAIGAGFGYFDRGNVLLVTVGIMLIIYICNFFRWNKSITIAVVVFIAVMLDGGETNIFAYSVNRIIDTVIGIAVSLGVNYFVFPYDFDKALDRQIDNLEEKIQQSVEKVICAGDLLTLDEIKGGIDTLIQEFDTYKNEVGVKESKKQAFDRKELMLKEIESIYIHLKVLNYIPEGRRLDKSNLETMKRMGYNTCAIDGEPKEFSNNVYNFHVRALLDELNDLALLRNIED
ncbi:MAG TPA: hypothetical protein DHN33_03795 [Eubacteriaceae bacterium]|nr:hypothetical protein [Eubacteriaceae bacterium]